MKQEAGKKKMKWLIPVIIAAVLLIAGALVAVFMLGGGQDDPAANAAGRADIYWNIDKKINTDAATGLSIREPAEDGLYHIRFAFDGEQVELTAADKKLVNRIDMLDFMGLVLDADGNITDVKAPGEICTVAAENFYVQKQEGNVITTNSSAALNGMSVDYTVTENTGIYNVSAKAEVCGQVDEVEPMDKVIVLQTADGETTHIFIVERPESSDVYWRVGTYYKNKETTRVPDENGVYHILFAVNGEQVTLPCKDKEVVNAIDALANNVQAMGLTFDEEGYINGTMTAAQAVRGALVSNQFDVIEINGTHIKTQRMLPSSNQGATWEGNLAEDCKIYEVSGVADFVGQEVEELLVTDRVYVLTDAMGDAKIIFVTNRMVEGDLYWLATRYYDNNKQTTTLQPEADGYYYMDFVVHGELVTLRSNDLEIVNQVQAPTTKALGMKLDGDVIQKVYHFVSITGGWTVAAGTFVETVNGPIVTTVSTSGTTNTFVMSADCEVMNVCFYTPKVMGEYTTLQPGDKVTPIRNAAGEVIVIYVTQRQVDAPVYWNVSRKYNGTTKETTRKPLTEGEWKDYYEFTVTTGGNRPTKVYTKSKEIATSIDKISPQAVGLQLSGKIVQKAYSAAVCTGGSNMANGCHVEYWENELPDADGISRYYALYRATGNGTTVKFNEDTQVYNVSAAASYVGIKDMFRLDDRCTVFTDRTGVAKIIYITERPVYDEPYYNMQQMYSSSKGETTRKPDADGYYVFDKMIYKGKQVTVKTKDKDVASEVDSFGIGLGMHVSNGIVTRGFSISNLEGYGGNIAPNYDIVKISGKTLTLERTRPSASNQGDVKEVTISSSAKFYDVSPYAEKPGAVITPKVGDRVVIYRDDDNKVGVIGFVTFVHNREGGAFGYCEHCDQEVYWNHWEGAFPANAGTEKDSDTVHYYMTHDRKVDSQALAGNAKQTLMHAVLDLNGKTLESKTRALGAWYGATLYVTDSSKDQTGTVIGRGHEGGKDGAGVALTTRGGNITIYGGNWKVAEDHYTITNGGILNAFSHKDFAGGKITINGGKFYGTEVTGNGGAVSCNSGEIIINGGEFFGGTAGNIGGTLHSANTLTINGGIIHGGKASYGATVSVPNLIVNGGTIESGEADKLGNCMYISSTFKATITGGTIEDIWVNSTWDQEKGFVKISGTPTIKNMDIAAGKLMDMTGLTGGSITVNASGVFTTEFATAEAAQAAAKFVLPALEEAEIGVSGKQLSMGIFKCLLGHTEADHAKEACEHEILNWSLWTNANKLPNTTGNYILTTDVTTVSQTSISGHDVVLDLNGHDVTYKIPTARTANFRLYYVNDSLNKNGKEEGAKPGSLIITDNSTDDVTKQGTITSVLPAYAMNPNDEPAWRENAAKKAADALDEEAIKAEADAEAKAAALKKGKEDSAEYKAEYDAKYAELYAEKRADLTALEEAVKAAALKKGAEGSAEYTAEYEAQYAALYATKLEDLKEVKYKDIFETNKKTHEKGASGMLVHVAHGNFTLMGGHLDASGLTVGSAGTAIATGAMLKTMDQTAQTVTIKGGTVSAGTTTVSGGAIYVDAGTTLTMLGGTVNGGTLSNNAHGAAISGKGNIVVSGGTVNGGTGATNSGAIYADGSAATVTIDGTAVINPGKATNGDSMYVRFGTWTIGGNAKVNGGVAISKASLTVTGAPTILKQVGGSEYSLKLVTDDIPVTFKDLKDGAKIAISQIGVFSTQGDTAEMQKWIDAGYFISEVEGKVIMIQGGCLSVADADAIDKFYCVYGHTSHDNITCSEPILTWSKWSDTTKLPTKAGNYYLADNSVINLSAQVMTAVSDDIINLDLRGSVVTAAPGVRALLTRNACYTITDTRGDAVIKTADTTVGKDWNGAVVYAHTGELRLINVTLDASSVTENAAFGAALFVLDKATVTLEDVTIKGGAAKQGGAIFSNGELVVADSTITGDVYAGKDVTVKGTVNMDELNLAEDALIDANELTGGKIVVNADGAFTTEFKDEETAKNAAQFFESSTGLGNFEVEDGKIVYTLKMCVLGHTESEHAEMAAAGKACEYTEILDWKLWTNANKLPNATGNYILTKDVTVTSQTSLVGTNVIIDLNGFNVTYQIPTARTANFRVFYLNDTENSNGKTEGATPSSLIITDNSTDDASKQGSITSVLPAYAMNPNDEPAWRESAAKKAADALNDEAIKAEADAEAKAAALKKGKEDSAEYKAEYDAKYAELYAAKRADLTALEEAVKAAALKKGAEGSAEYTAEYEAQYAALYATKLEELKEVKYKDIFETNKKAHEKGASGMLVHVAHGNFTLLGGHLDASGLTVGSAGTAIATGAMLKTMDQTAQTVTIKGGTVSGGTTTVSGGAIYVDAGTTLTMLGGTVNGGTLSNNAHGAAISGKGNIVVSGGTVNGGTGATNSGAIYADGSAATVTIDGTAVINPGKATNGDSMYIRFGTWVIGGNAKVNGGVAISKASLTITGAPTIQKVEGGSEYSLKMVTTDVPVTFTGLTEGAKIAITSGGLIAKAQDGVTTVEDLQKWINAGYFVSDNAAMTFGIVDDALTLGKFYCVYGHTSAEHANMTCAEPILAWSEWTNTSKLPDVSGNYYLPDGAVLNITKQGGVVDTEKDYTVNLDLRGSTLTTSDNRAMLLKTTAASVYTITDTKGGATLKTGVDTISKAGDGALLYANIGTVRLINVNVDASSVATNANRGSAIFVLPTGTLIAENSTIIGGNAKNGEAIRNSSSGTIILNNTTVTGGLYQEISAKNVTLIGNTKLLPGTYAAYGVMGTNDAATLNCADLGTGAEILAANLKYSFASADAAKAAITNGNIKAPEGYVIRQVEGKPAQLGVYEIPKAYCLLGHSEAEHTELADLGKACEYTEMLEWTTWTTANALPTESGNYVLNTDVTVGNQTNIASANVVIDLNGHDIVYNIPTARRSTFSVFNVTKTENGEGGSLIITDNSTADVTQQGSVKSVLSAYVPSAGDEEQLPVKGAERAVARIEKEAKEYAVAQGLTEGTAEFDTAVAAKIDELTASSLATYTTEETEKLRKEYTDAHNNGGSGMLVCVTNGSYLQLGGNLDASTLTTGRTGQAIYVAASQSATIKGGTVSGGKLTNNAHGAAISSKGTLLITGNAVINGGTGATNSGAVYAEAGTVTINGNAVVNPGQATNGDAIYARFGTWTIGGNAKVNGGVAVAQASLTVTGAPTILKQEGGSAYSLKLIHAKTPITFTALEAGAKIGITAAGINPISAAEPQLLSWINAGYLVCDDVAASFNVEDDKLSVGRYYCVYGHTAAEHANMTCAEPILAWTKWTGTKLPTEAGNYYLADNSEFNIATNTNVINTGEVNINLDLRGSTVTMTKALRMLLYRCSNESTYTITDTLGGAKVQTSVDTYGADMNGTLFYAYNGTIRLININVDTTSIKTNANKGSAIYTANTLSDTGYIGRFEAENCTIIGGNATNGEAICNSTGGYVTLKNTTVIGGFYQNSSAKYVTLIGDTKLLPGTYAAYGVMGNNDAATLNCKELGTGAEILAANLKYEFASADAAKAAIANGNVKTLEGYEVRQVAGDTGVVLGIYELPKQRCVLGHTAADHAALTEQGKTCEYTEMLDWTTWETANALPTESGNYVLNTDVTVGNQTNIASANVVIDLNGHDIVYNIPAARRSTFSVFNVTKTENGEGGSLIITDNSTDDVTQQGKVSSVLPAYAPSTGDETTFATKGEENAIARIAKEAKEYAVAQGLTEGTAEFDAAVTAKTNELTASSLATYTAEESEAIRKNYTNSHNNGGSGMLVYVTNGSYLQLGGNLDASTLTTGKIGQAIYVAASQSATIKGGTVSGGKLTNNAHGAAISSKGTLLITGNAVINGGTGATNSGAVYAEAGTVTMNGNAVINPGKATNGDAIYARFGTWTIGGNAKVNGGVAVAQASLTVTGAPTILKQEDGSAYSLKLVHAKTPITFTALEAGAKIGITAAGINPVSAAEPQLQSWIDAGYLVCDSQSYEFKVEDNKLSVTEKEITVYCVNGHQATTPGGTCAVEGCGQEVLSWTKLSSDITKLPITAGNYYFAAGSTITLDGCDNTNDNSVIRYDLRGSTITQSKENYRVLLVNGGANVTFLSTMNGAGTLKYGKAYSNVDGAILYSHTGTLNLKNVTVDASNITSNAKVGGAIFVLTNGTLNLDGVTVKGGAATTGGAIFNQGLGVTVKNSTIIGSEIEGNGGAIYNSKNMLTIEDSTVTGEVYNSNANVTIADSTLTGLFHKGGQANINLSGVVKIDHVTTFHPDATIPCTNLAAGSKLVVFGGAYGFADADAAQNAYNDGVIAAVTGANLTVSDAKVKVTSRNYCINGHYAATTGTCAVEGCGQEILTWNPKAADLTALPSATGNYYLPDGANVNLTTQGGKVDTNNIYDIKIDLRGSTLQQTADARVGMLKGAVGSQMVIIDTIGGSVIKTTKTESNISGGCAMLYANQGTIRVVGVKLDSSSITTNEQVNSVATVLATGSLILEDCEVIGGASSNGVSISNAGNLTIKGSTITGKITNTGVMSVQDATLSELYHNATGANLTLSGVVKVANMYTNHENCQINCSGLTAGSELVVSKGKYMFADATAATDAVNSGLLKAADGYQLTLTDAIYKATAISG